MLNGAGFPYSACENKMAFVVFTTSCIIVIWPTRRGPDTRSLGPRPLCPSAPGLNRQQQHRERWLNDLARFPVHSPSSRRITTPFRATVAPFAGLFRMTRYHH